VIAVLFGYSVGTEVAVAVVFYSTHGHTARQAEAEQQGIEKIPGASTLLLTSDEAQTRWEILERANAIIFGAPIYMSSFKPFMDATSKIRTAGTWRDKVAAGRQLGVSVRRQTGDTNQVCGSCNGAQ